MSTKIDKEIVKDFFSMENNGPFSDYVSDFNFFILGLIICIRIFVGCCMFFAIMTLMILLFIFPMLLAEFFAVPALIYLYIIHVIFVISLVGINASDK